MCANSFLSEQDEVDKGSKVAVKAAERDRATGESLLKVFSTEQQKNAAMAKQLASGYDGLALQNESRLRLLREVTCACVFLILLKYVSPWVV